MHSAATASPKSSKGPNHMRSKLIRAALACGTLSAVMLLGSCSSSHSKKDKQAEEDAKMAGDLFNNRGGNLAAPLVKPVGAEFGEAPVQLPPKVAVTPPVPVPTPKPANIVVAPKPIESVDIPVVVAPTKPVGKVTPPKVPSVAATPKVPSKASTYSIQKGDILGKVAQDHGVKTADLLAANPGVDPARLKIGQKINIPAAGAKSSGSKAPSSATKTGSKTAAKTPSKSTGSKSSGSKVSSGEYTVVSGDFPEKIAKKLGVKQADLMAANPGLNPTGLKIGQKLKVPGSSSSSDSAHAAPRAHDPADVGTAPVAGDATPPAPAAPALDISTLEKLAYTTAPGDTLETLAANMSSTVELIKAANPSIKSNADLKPNTSISIPISPR